MEGRENCNIFSERLHFFTRVPWIYKSLRILHYCPKVFLSRVVVVQKFRVAYREIYPRSNLIFLRVHSFIYETFKSIVGYSRYIKRKHCMTTVEPLLRPHLPCDHLTKTPKCSQSNPCNQNLSLKRPPHRSERDHFFLAWRFCRFQYCLCALVSDHFTHDVVSGHCMYYATQSTRKKLTQN